MAAAEDADDGRPAQSNSQSSAFVAVAADAEGIADGAYVEAEAGWTSSEDGTVGDVEESAAVEAVERTDGRAQRRTCVR